METELKLEWIKPEDRLPELNEMVLVIVNGRFRNVKFFNSMEIATLYPEDNKEVWILDSYPQWKIRQSVIGQECHSLRKFYRKLVHLNNGTNKHD